MPDVHDKATRSRNMSAIRGKDTKPEILIRKELHRRGFRFRLHDKRLPGKPDIVLPKHSAVIQVNGCFWHGHDCSLFKVPGTRTEFWLEKIGQNKDRDKRNSLALKAAGWREAIVWECALKRSASTQELDNLGRKITEWLLSGEESLVIDENRSK